MAQERVRTQPRDVDHFRLAFDDFVAARVAWQRAHDAWVSDPTSEAASIAAEAARHDLQMAHGRLSLEEAALESKRRRGETPEKAWGSH